MFEFCPFALAALGGLAAAAFATKGPAQLQVTAEARAAHRAIRSAK